MAPVTCPIPGCDTTFGEDLDAQALTSLINLHARVVHPPTAAPQTVTVKAEKVRRPTVTPQGTTEDWLYFICRWEEYKAATKLTGPDVIFQLLETCDESLRKDLTRTYGTLVGESEGNVLRCINTVAIKPENTMVARVQLQSLRQERDEPVRSFSARLRGQAGVCQFTKIKKCTCGRDVSFDFSDDMIRDALIRGLEDDEIRLHILGQANQDMSLDETLQLAEAQECGKRSAGRLLNTNVPATSTNAASTYRRRSNTRYSQSNQPHQQYQHNNSQSNQQYQHNNSQSAQFNQRNNNQQKPPPLQTSTQPTSAICNYCGQQGHGKSRNERYRKWNCPAFDHRCSKCDIPHHFERVCRRSQLQNQQTQDAVVEDTTEAGFFYDATHDRICTSTDS